MIAKNLRKIERELADLAAQASDEHPIDPHALRVIAVKLAAQAEMLEKGLEA